MTETHERMTEGAPATRSLTIEAFSGDQTEWDGVLDGLPSTSFCHLYGWKDVMESGLGHESMWRIARDSSGRVQGLLPLVRVRSRLFGDYLMSMPFLNYGGPVGTPEARRALANAAGEDARRLGVDLLELRTRYELPGSGLSESTRKVTVLKDLPADPAELWEKGLKAKVRSQVRRPMKEGMEVRFGGDLLPDFYQVFSRTMRDLGTPVLPIRFFQLIQSNLSEQAVFAVVYRDGTPLAAGCGFAWKGEFEISWAGSSREHARLAPNMLLYWGCMEECVRREIGSFNFGRCTPGSGTHRFKLQWGSRDQPLPWLQWTSSGVGSTPDPDKAKYRIATKLWSRAPVWFTNSVGPSLSRLLP